MFKGRNRILLSNSLVWLSFVTLILVACMISLSSFASAQEASSPNYKVDELFIGTGNKRLGLTKLSGPGVIGDLGVGNSASTNFKLMQVYDNW